jgi:4-amino-4-deoxy-L-arabinose transferase-like glycosyltransferase
VCKLTLRAEWISYLSLMAIFVSLSLCSALQKSPTFDETVHLFAGYSYLKWGDYRVNPEHPPLVKMLAAAPLLALDLNDSHITPRERSIVQRDKNYGWTLAHRFVFSDNDAETLFFYARLGMLLLAVALAGCIVLWARELYGTEAAIAGLLLFCFDPNIIAHSTIIQTDIPFALFFFSSTYFYWRSLKRLSWLNLLMTALLFALATITKFSFVAILPVWLLLGLIAVISSAPLHSPVTTPAEISGRWKKAALVSTILIVSLMMAYVATWTAYRFRFDAELFQMGQLPVINFSGDDYWLSPLVRLCREHLVLPEAWLFGISDAYQRIERPAYLLGEISKTGFWMFFPVAFLMKTPVATILLVVIATGGLAFHWSRQREALFLLIPPVIFFLLAVTSRLNVGLRHILPVYPFLFVWMSGTIAALWKSRHLPLRIALMFLGVWFVGSALWTYPNYLAYFNEIAGGPANGYKILVDSSLDWGQDLKELKKWMDRNGVGQIQFAYFGTADPAYYKINALHLPESVYVSNPPLTGVAKTPPYVAISATILVGLYLDDPNRYARFRERKPVAVIGNSIFVYKVTD